MSKKKQGGKLTQQKRTQPKYLGVKVADGQRVSPGMILIRQRGTRYGASDGVKSGRDHTLYSTKTGVVKFKQRLSKKYVSVI